MDFYRKDNVNVTHITELEAEDEVTHDISELPNRYDASNTTDNQILSTSQIRMVDDLGGSNSLYDDDQDVEPSHSNDSKQNELLQEMAETGRKDAFNPIIKRDTLPVRSSIEDSIKGTFFAQVKSHIALQGNIMVVVGDSIDNQMGRGQKISKQNQKELSNIVMENIDSLRKQMKEYEQRRLPNPFGE
jgi:hypothetical protein